MKCCLSLCMEFHRPCFSSLSLSLHPVPGTACLIPHYRRTFHHEKIFLLSWQGCAPDFTELPVAEAVMPSPSPCRALPVSDGRDLGSPDKMWQAFVQMHFCRQGSRGRLLSQPFSESAICLIHWMGTCF